MNQTKWNELRNAMLDEMPFPPSFIIKTLFGDVYHDAGDWYEGLMYGDYFHGEFAIEWIKVRPRYLKHGGRLIEPELIDESQLFEAILRRYNITYEKLDGDYCIYGYK